MTTTSRFARAAALLAAVSLAVPAAAVELPARSVGTAVPATMAWNSDSQNADGHRYRRYRRDRGIDAGDVIAGAVILGTVAAIANAANRSNRDYRDRDYRSYPYRDRPYQYRPYRGDSRALDSRGIDRAVDICVREVERESRIRSVDSVNRLGDGWRVAGATDNGDAFTCRIGRDGRVEGVDYGQRAWDGASADGSVGDRQWDDEAYAQARRAQDGGRAQPAYPGGPIEGEIAEDYPAEPAPDFGA